MKEQKIIITNRECEFLLWLSNGLTAKEIANQMDISPRTVEDYIRKVRQKTNLYKRSQLISFFKAMTV